MKRLLFSVLAVAFALPAQAQNEPKFDFAKPPDVKVVQWKLSAQTGLVYTTGNSRSISFSAGAHLQRDDTKNRFILDANGAYVRTTLRLLSDANGDSVIQRDEIIDETRTTTALWAAKLRYDRFFSPRNTLYITGGVLGNRPAGKIVVASGQLGYSRLLHKGKRDELAGEAGYDFTFERDVGTTANSFVDLFIHSVRLFIGFNLTITETTSFSSSFETLINLNPEVFTLGTGERIDIAPAQDTRFTGKAAFTTKLWKVLSLRVGFTARYDNAPAVLALPAGTSFEPGFLPFANRLDTITEVALVASIL